MQQINTNSVWDIGELVWPQFLQPSDRSHGLVDPRLRFVKGHLLGFLGLLAFLHLLVAKAFLRGLLLSFLLKLRDHLLAVFTI